MALLVFSFLLCGIAMADPPGTRSGSPGAPAASASDSRGQAGAGSSAGKVSGVLVGRLRSVKGFPVAWALVSLAPRDGDDLEAESYSFVSGRDGTFMAGSIKPGIYRVLVSHVSYKPAKPFFVKISAHQEVIFSVVLEEQMFENSSIIVIAERALERAHLSRYPTKKQF